jgi:hypothetical protein
VMHPNNSAGAATVRAYVGRIATGCALGVLYGLLGIWKASGNRETPIPGADRAEMLAIAAVAGAASGALWHRLRFLRARNRLGYYTCWIVSVTVPIAAMAVPYSIREGSWTSIGVALFIGIGGGVGFATSTWDPARNRR